MKPAILGGTPIRSTMLPYAKQYIDDEDCLNVVNALKSDFLTTGPKVKEFEEVMASYVGTKYAVAFSNGTTALHGACYAAGVRVDDEIITTPITFAASANCGLYMGAIPIFADINEDTFIIDVNEIEKKLTSKTKAIIPVDYTGQAVDIDAIRDLVKDKDIVIIEDAAHSLGTRYKGSKIGGLADMTMFSFHPVKTITTGEGGIITTNNEEYYSKLIDFRAHGITRNIDQLENKEEGSWYYEQLDLGHNFRMTDFQAALGISQMKKIDKFIERRKEIVSRYNEVFKDLEGVIIQQNDEFSDTVNHLYVIKLDLPKLSADRNKIFNALISENIGANVHYIPVYWHPYYQKLGYKKGLCPKSEELYKGLITIPLFPAMTDKDVEDVTNGVSKIINYYRR